MIRAVLWDNDGVLVDTERLFFEASRLELARAGVSFTIEQYRDLTLRQGRSCFELLDEHSHGPEAVRRIRKARNARYLERLRQGVPLMDGVAEALARLHGRLPMAIVTSSNPEPFAAIHAPLGVLRFFEFALTSGDYERHKPHPEPYLKAAERLGLEPSDCLVVEDSERGLRAATSAEMPCFVVPNELTRDCDFGAALRVLADVREVPDELERMR